LKKKDFVREEKIAEEDVKAKEAAAKAEAKAKQVRSDFYVGLVGVCV
jgi:hypothetical protein